MILAHNLGRLRTASRLALDRAMGDAEGGFDGGA